MIRRTSALDLAIPFVLALGVIWVVLRHVYGSLAPLSFVMPVPSIVLGFVELVLARRVRNVIAHDPDTKPMTAIAIARCAALGKATAIAAAVVAGAFAAMLLRVVPSYSDFEAARHDTLVSAIGLAGSLLLLTAGLVLERSAIIPKEPRT